MEPGSRLTHRGGEPVQVLRCSSGKTVQVRRRSGRTMDDCCDATDQQILDRVVLQNPNQQGTSSGGGSDVGLATR